MNHKRVQHFGKIQSSVLTLLLSDGMTMALQFKEAHRHQKLCSGRDQLKWDKAIQNRHLSGVTSINQFQMELSSSHSVTAGSSQPHQLYLRILSVFTDSHTIENITRMAPSDFISGSKMAGMVLM